jgi:RHS repeat-associated protein
VFGAVRGQTGDADTDWRFTGELQDSTAGEAPYYLRARYYDEGVGRFLTRDVLTGAARLPQSLNRYSYAINNPSLLIDPSGMCIFGAPCPKPLDWVIEKGEDLAECASNIPGCTKTTVEQRLLAPGLDRLGQAELAQCVRARGIEGCAVRQGNRALDWGAKRVAKALVGEKGYIDLNATLPLTPWFGGVTVGVQLDAQKGFLKYGGVGFMTPGISITEAPGQTASEGLVCGVQAGLGSTVQGGVSVSGNPNTYYEIGGGSPGLSATCFLVMQ